MRCIEICLTKCTVGCRSDATRLHKLQRLLYLFCKLLILLTHFALVCEVEIPLVYLMQIRGLDVDQVGHMLYHQSGLLGVSGVSADPRELLPREDEVAVAEALALYVRRIVREIGALTAALGGLDMLVFTAGIGEHNAVIRERVCASLGWLGVALDAEANARHAAVVSTTGSRVRVLVEPTNEEWIAARAARDLLHEGSPAGLM